MYLQTRRCSTEKGFVFALRASKGLYPISQPGTFEPQNPTFDRLREVRRCVGVHSKICEGFQYFSGTNRTSGAAALRCSFASQDAFKTPRPIISCPARRIQIPGLFRAVCSDAWNVKGVATVAWWGPTRGVATCWRLEKCHYLVSPAHPMHPM